MHDGVPHLGKAVTCGYVTATGGANALSALGFFATVSFSMGDDKTGVSETAVRDELTRVLSSASFAQSESLKRFLQHVVETSLDGRDDELKETILGASVFDRGDDYDPRLDPIVRVQATRLRSKLRDYYHEHGIHDDVVIELPKGSYVPEFRFQDASDERAPAPSPAPKGLGIALAAAAALVVVALVVVTLWPSGGDGDVRSLVVLPFTDMSPDGEFGYYGDGLAEEITTTLARADGLQVVPRTTAFAFRDRELGSVGEALQVDAVLQGSVRKSGDTLRIAAQLIRASDGRQIWNDSYEEDDDNAFQVQEGIARSVATAIEKELGVAESPVPDALAYEELLKARYELSRTTPASVGRAIGLFEAAIEADPDYAPAHAGLVQAYVVNVLWGFDPPDETRELARIATEHALALDGDHEEAFAAAAAYQLIYEWDVDRSQQILDRAADEGIRSAAIHTMQGILYLARGLVDEAEAAFDASLAEERNAPFVLYLKASAAHYAGRDGEALATLDALGKLAPDYILVPSLVSKIRLAQGDTAAARTALEEFERLAGDARLELVLRAAFDARTGRGARARELVETLQADDKWVPPAFIARVLIALGDHDAALTELERGAGEGSLPVLSLAADPDLGPLRDDPRFTALLDALGVR